MILLSVILLIITFIYIAIIAYKIKKENDTTNYIKWYTKSSINLISLILNIMLLWANIYYKSYLIALISIPILIANITFSIFFIFKFR